MRLVRYWQKAHFLLHCTGACVVNQRRSKTHERTHSGETSFVFLSRFCTPHLVRISLPPQAHHRHHHKHPKNICFDYLPRVAAASPPSTPTPSPRTLNRVTLQVNPPVLFTVLLLLLLQLFQQPPMIMMKVMSREEVAAAAALISTALFALIHEPINLPVN